MNDFRIGFSLLGSSQKVKASWLILYIFIGMLLETLGIGLILPALTILLDYDTFLSYPIGLEIVDFLGNPDQDSVVKLGLLAIVLIYFLKIIFMGLLAHRQTAFIFNVQQYLSLKLVAGYLHQPYSFHVSRNSSELIRNATTEVAIYISGLVGMIWVVTEGLIMFGVLSLLAYIEPLGSMVVLSVITISGLIFMKLTGSRVEKWGELREFHEGKRIQHIQQGLGSIKDLIILGRTPNFVLNYKEHNKVSAEVGFKQGFLQAIPRLWMEAMVILGIVTLVIAMLLQEQTGAAVIPILAVFATAAYRLMPSFSKLVNGWQNIKYAKPVLKNLTNEVAIIEAIREEEVISSEEELKFSGEVIAKDLSFSFPGENKRTIDGLNLNIKEGEVIGFAGSSGAGKSTLINLLLGLLKPSEGKICSNGNDIYQDIGKWRSKIGFIPQDIYLSDDTIRNNIALGLLPEEIDEYAIKKSLDASSLSELIGDLDEGLDTMVGERGVRLSGGQQQRIGIARALYNDPDILIMDEATSALDVEIEESIMTAVENLQGSKTILIIAHRLTVIDRCDRVYKLKDGKLSS